MQLMRIILPWILLAMPGCQPGTDPGDPPATVTYATLVGQWERVDGNYTIEVRSVADDGAVEAGYYNPNPVHIALAEAKFADEILTLFIELRDRGYPGCTYQLRYGADDDRLWGTYYQAAQGERYSVVFQRQRLGPADDQ